jgi:hypothetical protein
MRCPSIVLRSRRRDSACGTPHAPPPHLTEQQHCKRAAAAYAGRVQAAPPHALSSALVSAAIHAATAAAAAAVHPARVLHSSVQCGVRVLRSEAGAHSPASGTQHVRALVSTHTRRMRRCHVKHRVRAPSAARTASANTATRCRRCNAGVATAKLGAPQTRARRPLQRRVLPKRSDAAPAHTRPPRSARQPTPHRRRRVIGARTRTPHAPVVPPAAATARAQPGSPR